ncbi:hypothetical protein F1C16_21405 (plasmid) [Hymenobacter sp. NBH84]|uniref:hypothetical protein n=1 Tax=Hymenobacter sp. NBH84 TaxID=2596915 RepID=UPI001627666B|nr:hypothetical protein [Hymenobacter sp. NBH84]QNE42186.1 hypothetical protein F1C16_21405 [Hymenobacter sp. NBH84]
MNVLLKAVSALAFIISCVWASFTFDFEPIIAAIGSLGALLGLIVNEREKKKEREEVARAKRSLGSLSGGLTGKIARDIARRAAEKKREEE